MTVGASLLVGAVGSVVGLAAGVAIRHLLARIPRGARLTAGPVEAAAGAITAVGAVVVWPGALVALTIWVGVLAVALGAVDIRHHRLPDALTLPAIPVTALLVVGTELADPAAGDLVRAALAAAALGGAFWLLAVVAPAAMGRGDVKLVPSLALATGYVSWEAALVAVLAAFALGAAFALAGLLLRRVRLTSSIAFGPFLLLGAWLTLVLTRPAVATGLAPGLLG